LKDVEANGGGHGEIGEVGRLSTPPEEKGHDILMLVLLTEPVRIWKAPGYRVDILYNRYGARFDKPLSCASAMRMLELIGTETKALYASSFDTVGGQYSAVL
jgi:hypothetical protein